MSRETQLEEILIQIGNLPLEFNTRARALAQRAINQQGVAVKWAIPLTDDEIYKVVDRGGLYVMPPKEQLLETKQPGEETLYPVNPTTYQPPEIDMIPVTSSNIESIGHDGAETLRVKFQRGAAYDYVGLNEDDFFSLLNAESIGRAYQQLTKGRGITGIKLD